MRILVALLFLSPACVIDTVPLPEASRGAGVGGGDTAKERDDNDATAATGDPASPPDNGGDAAGECGDTDVRYDTWSSCGYYDATRPETAAAAVCLCEGVNACEAVSGVNWLALGSEHFRVCGIAAGQCVVSVFAEIESGGTGSRCAVALDAPVCDHAPLGAGDLTQCEVLFSCNLFLEDCPANLVPCE